MIVAGGGTGGHLFPGLAVAYAVAARPDARVLFIGSSSGIEATAVPQTPFPFEPLAIRGVRGRGLAGLVSFAWQLPVALVRAWGMIGRFRPTIVLGLGGYGSIPVVLAAWLRRVPSVLLEQNVHPGLANRWLSHLARRVCTTFPESARFFPAGKAVQTGNPVRELRSAPHLAGKHFTLFVFGGSQGARTINRATVGAARALRRQLPELQLIHQTGGADVDWVREQYRDAGVEAEVVPFVHDMGEAYGRADLVICRAGASTLAELTALGKPAILVPYPFAVDDHQRANAEVLVRHGAAELIADGELTAERLEEAVMRLARARARLSAMAEAARQLAIPDAAERVVEVCLQMAVEGG